MRHISPVRFIKNKLVGIWPAVYDVLGENADGGARSRRAILFGNYFGSIAATLVSGLYFTGLLIAMEAGDAYIGYITVATTACGFVQLFSPLFLERLKRRKPFLMSARAVYYFINIFALGAIPVLPLERGLKLGLFMGFVMLMNAINSFSSPGYSIWHIQNLPDEKRARFFSISSVTGAIISAAATFSAGFIMDGFENSSGSLWGISPTISAVLVLRALALLAAVFEFYYFAKIRELDYSSGTDAKSRRGLKLILLPLKNKPFLRMTSVSVLWTYSTAIIGSYYSVYLIEDLGISYAFLSSLGLVVLPLTLIFTPVWAAVIRRVSWLRAMSFAMLFYAFAYIGNVFVTAKTALFVYPLIVVWCYVFSPGISLVFANLPYLKMPGGDRTAYLSFYSTVSSLASLLGAYTGTLIITSTAGLRLSLFGFSMVNKQYINLLQFCLVIILAFYIRSVHRRDREGITPEKNKEPEKTGVSTR